jgi:CheY-like chemotaxis protein
MLLCSNEFLVDGHCPYSNSANNLFASFCDKDVILMDLEMPDDDRWEAVRRLKNDPQTQDIPIIGMSAHAVESEREKAIATGCDEFDAKPIDFEILVATIRRVLAPHK